MDGGIHQWLRDSVLNSTRYGEGFEDECVRLTLVLGIGICVGV